MELLKRLYAINSKSGREDEIKRFILSSLSHITLDIKEDEFGNLFLTKGNAEVYPCVAAHLDEVHMPSARIIVETPPTICAVNTEGARVGLGADDKNGLWIIINLLQTEPVLKVALFVQEERDGELAGCRGARVSDLSFFSDVEFVVECDRKGASDVVNIGKGETSLCDSGFIPEHLLHNYGYELVKGLKDRVKQCAVTNGTKGSAISTLIFLDIDYFKLHFRNTFKYMLRDLFRLLTNSVSYYLKILCIKLYSCVCKICYTHITQALRSFHHLLLAFCAARTCHDAWSRLGEHPPLIKRYKFQFL